MEDENSGGANANQPNRHLRTRRSSSSLISSTTSHLPSQSAQSRIPRHAGTMSRSYGSFVRSSNNAPPGDEDEVQPSSSTSSFNSPSRQSNGNQRPSSPLGSPDSTYWGPSSISNSHQHRVSGPSHTSTTTTNSPLVQDPCVVSSSTTDDAPPSPFSQDESQSQNYVSHHAQMSRVTPPPVMPPPLPVTPNQGAVSIGRVESDNGRSSDSGSGQNIIREISQHQPSSFSSSSSSSYSSSIAFSSSSFSNISPLRNKIKKASSFERFSAQAQASSNSSVNNHFLNVSNNESNASNLQESNASIINPNAPSTSATSGTPMPRSSNGTWDYGNNSGSSPPKTNFVSSLQESASVLPSGTKPYHIKKLVARLASALELERLEATSGAAIASGNEEFNSSGNSSSVGIEIIAGAGRMSPLGANNSSESMILPSDSLIRRQLSQSPLNLAENSNPTTANGFSDLNLNSSTTLGLPIASRNPVISTKTFSSKKIPLTPKQKLLHRMQSGEITIPISTTPPLQQGTVSLSPPRPPSPLPEQPQNQILLSSLQQHQQHLLLHESLHPACGGEVLEEDAASSNNGRYTNALNNYEAFMRSTGVEEFSDSITKGDETTDQGSNQILYDSADSYNYYYGNILSDELGFGNGNNVNVVPGALPCIPSTSRLVHSSMGPNALEDDAGQFQVTAGHNAGHLEFVLGMPDHHERNGIREDQLQLENGEEIQIQQQQFLDPNELALVGGKSQLAEISTLRNLLMMEPLARSQHDESWISVAAAAEYQNRLSSSNLRLSGNSSSSIPGNNSSVSNGMIGCGNNSWSSEWPLRSWQGQGQQHDEGEQDEVMDMSVMEIEKTHLNSHSIIKRTHQHHPHPHLSSVGGHGMVISEVDLESERDLASGLPLLTSIPIDLQQPFGGNSQGGKNQLMTDSIIMTPQHHHRNAMLEYDDEPVNLMSAVNLEQDLGHHHSGSQHSENLSLSHGENNSSPNMVGDLNSHYGNVCVGSNIIFTTTSTTSTTVATAAYESTPPPPLNSPQQQPLLELISGEEANMDEKRIIRVKKKKENLDSTLESGDKSLKSEKTANLIPDKPVQPKSFASLPSLLSLTRMSGNGWGVVANRNKKIPSNARFGPVEGPLKRATKTDSENNDSVYPVLFMVDSAGSVYQLDRMDDDLCNWMKFVRRARSPLDQNVLVSEEDGLLYFTTCREIPPKAELQVGYSLEYAQKYNLPYFPIEGNPTSSEEQPVARKSGASKKFKRKAQAEANEFVCFECDMNCASVLELNKHLDSDHGDIDGFRRPKKKAIRKFYNALNTEEGRDEKDPLGGGNEDAEAESVCYTSKRSLKKKEIERLRREQEEIPVVESSSPDIETEKTVEVATTQQQEASSSSSLPAPKVKCNLCYKTFATQHRLQKHMIVHSQDYLKPLKCEVCGKRFLTNSALAGHSKSHEGKYFECPLCVFTTEQLLHLKEHVQSHKNDETGSFSCPHCPKTFTYYSLVRKHIRAFHGPRLFSCLDCKATFPTPDKLKLHELRHSSFRAYLCAECGRQFKRKDKLTDHAKKAHGKSKSQMARIMPVEPSIAVLLRPKLKAANKKSLPRLTEEQISKFTFRCQECMIGFRRRGMLVNHLAKRHPDIDPEHVPELALPITRTAKNYFCPHCERVYKSSSKRKSHILKNHPGKAVPPQVRGKDLKAILLEEKVGSTTIDLNLNDFESAEMEQIKVTVDEVIRKETVVGEIVGTPHACSWCHRQYASRAKLLQHQRKFHIELMPPEIQTPRPQKNNVRPSFEQVDIVEVCGTSGESVEPESEMDPEAETSVNVNDPLGKHSPHSAQNQENMFGYLITTSGHVTNNEIESLLHQPEIMMSLLQQQNPDHTVSSNPNNVVSRTITLCIPQSIISPSSPSQSSANTPPNTQLISTGINASGTQILTKTD